MSHLKRIFSTSSQSMTHNMMITSVNVDTQQHRRSCVDWGVPNEKENIDFHSISSWFNKSSFCSFIYLASKNSCCSCYNIPWMFIKGHCVRMWQWIILNALTFPSHPTRLSHFSFLFLYKAVPFNLLSYGKYFKFSLFFFGW